MDHKLQVSLGFEIQGFAQHDPPAVGQVDPEIFGIRLEVQTGVVAMQLARQMPTEGGKPGIPPVPSPKGASPARSPLAPQIHFLHPQRFWP